VGGPGHQLDRIIAGHYAVIALECSEALPIQRLVLAGRGGRGRRIDRARADGEQ
jgi:hypothetical protein